MKNPFFILTGLIIGLTPLLVVPGMIYPYTVPKAILFFVLVEIMAAIFLLKKRSLNTKLFRSPIMLILASLIGVQILSALGAEDLSRSFFGIPTRMTGIFASLHFLIFLLISASTLQKEEFEKLFRLSLLISSIIAVISLLQYFFPGQFLNLRGNLANYSLLGSKIYVGYYALFHLFLGWHVLSLEQQPSFKKLWKAIILLQILTIVSLSIRGIIIGLVAGTAAVLLFWLWKALQEKKSFKKLIIGSVAILLIVGSALKFSQSFPDQQISRTVHRLQDFSFQSYSVQTRLMVWNIAWKAFREKPLLGWGPEHFELAFNRHYDPKLLRFNVGETWFDRSHNVFLDVLVDTGLIGALLFLLLVLTALYRVRRHPSFFALLISLFVASLVEVESFVSVILLLLLIGSVLAEHTAEKEWFIPKGFRWSAAFFFLLLVSLQIFSFSGFYHLNRAVLGSLLQLDTQSFQERFQKGYDRSFFAPTVQQDLVQNAVVYLLQLKSQNKFSTISASFMEFMDQKIQRHLPGPGSSDVKRYYAFGRFYKLWGAGDPTKYILAEELFSDGLSVNNTRQVFYFSLGDLRFQQGKKEEGVQQFAQAIFQDEKAGFPHWYMAKAFINEGQYEGAIREIKLALKLGHQITDAHEIGPMIRILEQKKEYKVLHQLVQRLVEIEPWNPERLRTLAKSYLLIGDRENAKKTAERAVKMDPSLEKGIEDFYTMLEKP